MSIEDDLLSLAELDRRIVRAVMESDASAVPALAAEYLQTRQRLATYALETAVATIADNDASAVLRKISGGDGLPSDRVIGQLFGLATPASLADSLDEHELQQLGESLFHSWFSHHEYIAGIAELRPLILKSDASEAVSRIVHQIKDCYAFQQYDAAYALCRTLVEASIRDICTRRNLFPDVGPNTILLEEYRWSDLRRKVATGPAEDRLKGLYRDLSTVLHGRKSVSHEEARSAFLETLEVVEALYQTHGL